MISREEQAKRAAEHYKAIRAREGLDVLNIPVYPLKKTSAAHSNRFRGLLLFNLLQGDNTRANYKFIDVDIEDYR